MEAFTAEAKKFSEFLTNHGGSPFVVAAGVRDILLAEGFKELQEADSWDLERGGKYFFVRNHAAVHAFAIGGAFDVENGVFAIAGAHTDSPALRMKPPRNNRELLESYMVLCETYGGGIWQTWFDRDLGMAGKVVVLDPETKKMTAKHILLRKPLFIIPAVAPHMDRSKYEVGFKVEKETQLRAIMADSAIHDMEKTCVNPVLVSLSERYKYHPLVIKAAAEAAGVKVENIVSMDLRLCDAQGASVLGMCGDYVCGQGIDNINGAYCCTHALVRAAANSEALAKSRTMMVINLFDHEETGSLSAQGARSNVVLDTLERALIGLSNHYKTPCNSREDVLRVARRSLILSADNTHAVHPNFSGRHVAEEPPFLNAGPVIKHHVGTSYASDAEGAALVLLIGKAHDIPVQEFVSNQDVSCGSTIGPMTGANTGICTVDIGCAQLAMHSIRETVGALDIERMIRLIAAFFAEYQDYSICP